MKRVFTAIKANKKDCLVSVAPNPQRFSYEFFLADWQKWERMGIIEDLVLQIYRNDLNVFISELEYPEVKAAQSHIPVSIGILSWLEKSNRYRWHRFRHKCKKCAIATLPEFPSSSMKPSGT